MNSAIAGTLVLICGCVIAVRWLHSWNRRRVAVADELLFQRIASAETHLDKQIDQQPRANFDKAVAARKRAESIAEKRQRLHLARTAQVKPSKVTRLADRRRQA